MTTATSRRTLGRAGPAVFPLGLGCMGMSPMYGPADEAESIATVHAALEAGITLFDTGDFYGSGHNELLLARALEGRREQAVLSVKFGALRGPDGAWTGVDARPAAVKNFLAYSLKRLKVDAIDIYRLARLDPQVPIEETVGAMAELVKAGYVKHVGLSEVGLETVRRAVKVHPIVDVQLEYSLVSRGPEGGLLEGLRGLGVGITAYGVLSRGLLSGSAPKGPSDFRAYLPRFQADAAAQNGALQRALAALASELGATASQLAIAWALSRGADVLPLVGSRTRAQLAEALGALRLELSREQLARLEAAVPAAAVVGTRYAPQHMQNLDSEQPAQG